MLKKKLLQTDRIPLRSTMCSSNTGGELSPHPSGHLHQAKPGYSRVRRMSVPAVPLAMEFDARVDRRQGLLQENKFCNSIETII